MTPAARMAIKASGTRAPFDLASAMVESVVEVGERRERQRAERDGVTESEPDE